jgi:hypothetical protein
LLSSLAIVLALAGCGGTAKSGGTGGSAGSGAGGDGPGGSGAGGSGAGGRGGSGAGGSGAGGSGAGGSGAGGSGAGGSGAGGSGAGGTGPTMTLMPPANGKIPTTPGECMGTADPGAFTFDRIATWRDDATAAYTMIHDDMCGPTLRGIDTYAVPALAMRGISSGMAPFVDVCEKGKLWDIVKKAEENGNEIINHSFTHPNITVENANQEVVMAKAAFDKQIKNPISFYVFPYDYWTDATLMAVQNAGHIGARAGTRDMFDGFDNPPLNTADDLNDMRLVFDVWPRAYSKYALFAAKDLLGIHVHNAIEKKAFAVREFHSISGRPDPKDDGSEGFGPVPLRTFEAHLDFLVNAWKSNKVWTSTPSTIIRYRQARKACTAMVSGSTITFPTPNATCTKYATPISVIVKSARDVPFIKATQGGNAVFTRKLGPSLWSVTADPTKGTVMLGGCGTAQPDYTVDASITLPAKPTPAASVCDLETVKGMGGMGQMDTLERNMESFQALPNPQQRDGRTGSWSWYPGGAVGVIAMDGANRVLKWSGGNLGAWAGVTLAFLGGNGAGSCYDASAYQGIRFKIKGSVMANDIMLDGKVVVSLVTAETQTQKYGGDLKGEGGHFNKIVPVTSTWTTVSIPWAELGKPTWGATAALPALAVGKLQAIDWGISNMTTAFDIYLDDIELY